MESPKKEDLKKLPTEMQEEMEKGVTLRHQDPEEKIVLPTSEDIQQEKTHIALLDEIETADRKSFHHVTPEEPPLPSKEDIEEEKTFLTKEQVIQDIQAKRASLTHVKTKENQTLPTAEDVAQEKQHNAFKQDVETFNREALDHTETEEKWVKPKVQVARERVKELAAKYDHNLLKSVKTVEKHQIVITEAGSGDAK